MGKLCVQLPPFSPDYSGVSAVLFDFKSLVVLHDASGCTGNYTGYDEPRWYGSQKAIYCSGLREIDAVMGNDDKLMDKIQSAAERLKPDFAAILGSPVPMIIGTDMKGIAFELEERLAIPVLGFDTTGLKYYNYGIAQALLSLAGRFMKPLPIVENTLNILGVTPLDIGHTADVQAMADLARAAGYEVNACLTMGGDMTQLQQAPSAAVNWVVTQAGLDLAEYMEAQFGIPYLALMPIGEIESKVLGKLWRQVQLDRESGQREKCLIHQGEVLIVGEQLIANSIRRRLASDYGVTGVTVGCLFGKDERLARHHDLDLADEAQIKQALNQEQVAVILADPLMAQLLRAQNQAAFFPLPQIAVSSKLYWEQPPQLIGSEMEERLAAMADHIKKNNHKSAEERIV